MNMDSDDLIDKRSPIPTPATRQMTPPPQPPGRRQQRRRLRPSKPHHRIVLLFDLDCFYAQCERVRLGLDLNVPICLLQWDSCLAVSYPAREFGIKRGDSWDDVSTKSNGTCWSIHLPIIPLVATTTTSTAATTGSNTMRVAANDGCSDNPYNHDDDNKVESSSSNNNNNNDDLLADEFDRVYKLTPEQQQKCQQTENGVRRHQKDGKACLERYRLASSRIFAVVLESLTNTTSAITSSTTSSSSTTKSFILEKASIDEFYLDITEHCYGLVNDEFDEKIRPTTKQEENDETENDEEEEQVSGVPLEGGEQPNLSPLNPAIDNVTTKKKTVYIGQSHEDQNERRIITMNQHRHNNNDFFNTTSGDDEQDDNILIQRALEHASDVAQQVRSDVWTTLGFTMSAGISSNKTMAKLAASYGKPNGQAVLHPKDFSFVLSETKMKKVRSFGGNLGNRILSMLSQLGQNDQEERAGDNHPVSIDDLKDSTTMNDISRISLPTLRNFFSSETAEHIFHAAQGIDNEPVKETSGALVKSITAFKSFPAMKNAGYIQKWLNVLSKEIVERVAQDTARNHRYPRTCTLNYSYYTTTTGTRPTTGSARSMRQSRSIRLNLPSERESMNRKVDNLMSQSMEKVTEILKQQHKLCGIGLAASNFEMRGPPQGMTSIQSFFQKKEEGDGGGSSAEYAVNPHQRSMATSPKSSSSQLGRSMVKKRPLNDISTFFSSSEATSPHVDAKSDIMKEGRLEIETSPSPSVPANALKIDHSQNELPVEQKSCESDHDHDMELAKKLQAQYDRENYVLGRSESNVKNRQSLKQTKSKKTKKNVARIDSFFSKKK